MRALSQNERQVLFLSFWFFLVHILAALAPCTFSLLKIEAILCFAGRLMVAALEVGAAAAVATVAASTAVAESTAVAAVAAVLPSIAASTAIMTLDECPRRVKGLLIVAECRGAADLVGDREQEVLQSLDGLLFSWPSEYGRGIKLVSGGQNRSHM